MNVLKVNHIATIIGIVFIKEVKSLVTYIEHYPLKSKLKLSSNLQTGE